MRVRAKNPVTDVSASPPAEALVHYQARFKFETDCWDVQFTQSLEERGFVLIDVRSPEWFERGHLPGAINIPHPTITKKRLAEYPVDTLFVVYCNGPHCNGSTKGAIRFARLGRPVKEMIGGTTGWVDEGFELVTS